MCVVGMGRPDRTAGGKKSELFWFRPVYPGFGLEMGKSGIFAACAGLRPEIRPAAGLRPAGPRKFGRWPACGRPDH